MALISDIDIGGHRINSTVLLVLLAVLVGWIVVYMLYKMFWHADFGLPVRRRLLARKVTIQRDQVAFAPMWWSDLQIQRAVSVHWKKTLRSTVQSAPDRRLEEPTAR